MTDIEIVLLTSLVILMIFSTIWDIREGIIPNKVLVIFLLIGCVLNVILYSSGEYRFFSAYIINVALILSISVLFYVINVWGAGDSKLLISVAVLIPGRFYAYSTKSILSGFWIISFSFIFAIIFVAGDTIVKMIVYKDTPFTKLTCKKMGSIIAHLVCCSLVMAICDEVLCFVFHEQYSPDSLLRSAICFIVSFIIMYCQITFSRNVLILLTAIQLFLLIIKIASLEYIKLRLVSIIVVILVYSLRAASEKYNYQTISIKDLRPGMILSLLTIMCFKSSKVKGLPESSTEDLRSRLSKEQVNAIIKWSKSAPGRDRVIIVRKIPFATFLCIGSMLFVGMGLLKL